MSRNIKLKFGKYKGLKLHNVPYSYLKWCIDNEILKGKALAYAKKRVGYPKDKYKVTVEDSVNADGVYIIEAYTKSEAMNICQKENKIQNTQSFCGTSYYAVKV